MDYISYSAFRNAGRNVRCSNAHQQNRHQLNLRRQLH
ncbi:hypothetical protein [Caudoviricetes sp.]|nr:hypothetical protein [Caudoviricetes sp.]